VGNNVGMRRVVILGSTGSIGTQAADVIARNPDRFAVRAIAAGGADLAQLAAQAVALRVEFVGIAREGGRAELEKRIQDAWPAGTPLPHILAGPSSTVELAALDADVILNAVAGAQGLRATLASLQAGRTVALANKESLIAGGSLVTRAAAPGQLVAVDSEHSALAQCLRSGSTSEVRRLVLTASGGPFRGRTRAELADVTPAQALAHPTWNMGQLVTTNSATLVNKGLEVIEAHLLFGVPYDRIEVMVHPPSVVHSMVEFVDGATIAQASPPDMRLPISLALGWPDRIADAAPGLDWTKSHTWTFEPLDNAAFPAVALARTAGQAGGCAPAVFNAANEELVAAFHRSDIGFLAIVDSVAQILSEWLQTRHADSAEIESIEQIEAADTWARTSARSLFGG
jgi:1-deoxy-D-xylulose-5-phosphate reductoisomerase